MDASARCAPVSSSRCPARFINSLDGVLVLSHCGRILVAAICMVIGTVAVRAKALSCRCAETSLCAGCHLTLTLAGFGSAARSAARLPLVQLAYRPLQSVALNLEDRRAIVKFSDPQVRTASCSKRRSDRTVRPRRKPTWALFSCTYGPQSSWRRLAAQHFGQHHTAQPSTYEATLPADRASAAMSARGAPAWLAFWAR